MTKTLVALLVGLAVTEALGWGFVGRFLNWALKNLDPTPPNNRLKAEWENITNVSEGGRYIGSLERLLFFAALWNDAPLAIAAWLTFKVATKWQAWTTVVAVPKSIEGIDELEYLAARRKWGSHLTARSLVGTLLNILIAYLGVLASRCVLSLS